MKIISIVLPLLLAIGCSTKKSNDSNTSLAALLLASSSSSTVSVPSLLTIVQDSLPAALKNTSYSSYTKGVADVQTIQTRLFGSGPANFRYRLSMVDLEITSLTTTLAGKLATTEVIPISQVTDLQTNLIANWQQLDQFQ